jgi:hypothetical protein
MSSLQMLEPTCWARAVDAGGDAPRGGAEWRPRCAARFEAARADASKIDPRFAKGRVTVGSSVEFALEFPTPDTWRFHPPGLWVTVSETSTPRASRAWHQVNQASPGELDSLFERQVGALFASVGEKVWLEEERRDALVRVWLAAVDACLGT